MTFEECLLETAKIPDLWKEFCRLKGYKLPTSPIEQLIDEATGREKKIVREYAAFVFEHIYLPLFVFKIA
jgi:hypothetical protein